MVEGLLDQAGEVVEAKRVNVSGTPKKEDTALDSWNALTALRIQLGLFFLPPLGSSVTLREEYLILQVVGSDPTREIDLWLYASRKQTEMLHYQKGIMS